MVKRWSRLVAVLVVAVALSFSAVSCMDTAQPRSASEAQAKYKCEGCGGVSTIDASDPAPQCCGKPMTRQ